MDDFNKNNNEVFTENELKELNEKLKADENIEVPESLSREHIEKTVETVKQTEPPKDGNGKGEKRSKRKTIEKFAAIAAAVAVVVTSAVIVKPWQKPKIAESQDSAAITVPEDYSEIENMFSLYVKNYKVLAAKNRVYGLFNGYTAEKSDQALGDIGVAAGSASNNTGAAVGNKTSPDSGESVTQGLPLSENATVSDDDNHGETNTQVKGVDEADIIKNDGKYIYTVMPSNADWDLYYSTMTGDESRGTVVTAKGYDPSSGNNNTAEDNSGKKFTYDCKIGIVETNKDGTLKKVGEINITPEKSGGIYYMSIAEIYVSGNRLTAIVNSNAPFSDSDKTPVPYQSKNIVMAVSFDISNRTAPKEEWRVFQDGYYCSSRMIGDELVLISAYGVPLNLETGNVTEYCIPKRGTDKSDYSRIPADNICVMDKVTDSSYIVTSVLDVKNAESTFKTEAVLGCSGNIYCNQNNLYVTSTQYEDEQLTSTSDTVAEIFNVSAEDASKTYIYKFDISDFGVKYITKGYVDGRTLNQFSIDEFDGNLRIATTKGFGGESQTNQLYVLDKELEELGKLENIAKGESIQSVRFNGKTGYVVTFLQTDPLFVIDLSNPASPNIKGELKIPGFSSYLHPVSDTLMLGIGFDGDDKGTNGNLKISLFDVSDAKAPKEASKIVLSNDANNEFSAISSEATYNHKAVCFDSVNSVLYIPILKTTETISSVGSYINSTYEYGAVAIKVDVENKVLSESGSYTEKSVGTEWRSVSRVTFTGNNLYTFSPEESKLWSFGIESKTLNDSLEIK